MPKSKARLARDIVEFLGQKQSRALEESDDSDDNESDEPANAYMSLRDYRQDFLPTLYWEDQDPKPGWRLLYRPGRRDRSGNYIEQAMPIKGSKNATLKALVLALKPKKKIHGLKSDSDIKVVHSDSTAIIHLSDWSTSF